MTVLEVPVVAAAVVLVVRGVYVLVRVPRRRPPAVMESKRRRT